MKSNGDGKIWLLVIDTDSYAGNFERPMTSYITGQCGETFGEEEMNIAREELPKDILLWLDENVVSSINDAGGWEVGHLTKSPDNSMNSVMIEFYNQPPIKTTECLKQRAFKYKNLQKVRDWDSRPNVLGFREFVRETTTTQL